MAGFVQFIEFTSSRIDDIRALSERMRAELGDALAARRSLVLEDRDRPGRYVIVVEFDSYDEAMANSASPAISSFAQEMSSMVDGAVEFRNLNLVAVEL